MNITEEDLRKERKRMEVERKVIQMAKENPYHYFLVGTGQSEHFWKLVKSICK